MNGLGLEPQSDALPIELLPPQTMIIAIAVEYGLHLLLSWMIALQRYIATIALFPSLGILERAAAMSRADS